jgi:hypothetical protein
MPIHESGLIPYLPSEEAPIHGGSLGAFWGIMLREPRTPNRTDTPNEIAADVSLDSPHLANYGGS